MPFQKKSLDKAPKDSSLKRQGRLASLVAEGPLGVDQLFEWIANGESMDKVASFCKTTRFVLYSFIDSRPEWRAKLQLARRAAADKYAEEVIGIADATQPGEERLANTRIEARKWTAAAYDPERFAKSGSAINVNVQELHLAAIQALEKTLRKDGYEEARQGGAERSTVGRGKGGLV